MSYRHPLCRAVARALSARRRPGYLLAAVAIASFSPPLAAQEADSEEIRQLDAVRVTAPIVASQAQSIELQREAVNVVSAIASDDIGQFPDQTAAAALARLPAVAVQRDQGQERYIQIRGAPSRWTSVAFDDINVIGADERIFRFDAVPAGLIDTVAISKTLTPAMPSEALAGRVNIETVSPMAQRGFHGQAELGYGDMELGDGNQYQGSVRLAWSNDTFGVLIGGSTYNREQITDNRELDYDDDGAPTMFDLRSYTLERETNSGLFKAEWRPASGHALTLASLYTEFKDHELRDQYVFNLGDALSGTRGADQGSLVGVPVNSQLQDGNYLTSTWTSTLAGSHALDVWDFGWAINYTETESTTDLPLFQQRQTSPLQFVSLDYDHRNRGLPTIRLYDTVAGASGFERGAARSDLDQNAFGLEMLIPIDVYTNSEAVTLKFDASRDLEIGDHGRLFVGAQIDSRSAEGRTFDGLGVAVLTPYIAALGLDWDFSRHIGNRQWHTNFPRGFGVSYVDNAGIRADLDRIIGQLEAAGVYDGSVVNSQSSTFAIDEDIQAAYAMVEGNFGNHQILGGVRFERAEIESSGFLVVDGEVVPTTVSKSTNDFFPSLHWNVDLTDTLKLRNALVTGLARPGFGQLRASASISDASRTVSGGNPELNPETAWGYDGSLEWYFAEASIASVGWFYRNVSDVLFGSVTTVEDTRFDGGGISRVGYDYTTTLNGGDGTLYGIELNYQQPFTFLPSPFDGFGVQLNLALIEGEFDTPEGRTVGFPGTSDQVFNASLYYEKYGLSARLAYQWRDRWLDDVSPDGTGDVYWDATPQLDLSVRYAFNSDVTLFFDANNLTDEYGVRYVGSTATPIEVEGFGRRYMAGVRVRF